LSRRACAVFSTRGRLALRPNVLAEAGDVVPEVVPYA
jgi:hypothetical protein